MTVAYQEALKIVRRARVDFLRHFLRDCLSTSLIEDAFPES